MGHPWSVGTGKSSGEVSSHLLGGAWETQRFARSILERWPVYIHVGSKLVLQGSNTGRSEIRGERNG
jgi:hypothetical protein